MYQLKYLMLPQSACIWLRITFFLRGNNVSIKVFYASKTVCILLRIEFHIFMLLILLTRMRTLFGQNRNIILRIFSGITISDIRDS